MKRSILLFGWIVSIFYALAILSIPFLFFFYATDLESKAHLGETIRDLSFGWPFKFIGVIAFIFWIYNVLQWKRKNGKTSILFFLLFFNVIYAPIYFIKELKESIRTC